jgi:hypothetical protein
MEKNIRDQYTRGFDQRFYLQIEEFSSTTARLYRQLQRYLGTPVIKFNAVFGKSVYSLWVILRLISHLALLTLVGLGVFYLSSRTGFQVNLALKELFSHPIFLLSIVFLFVINVRTLLFRLGDKEV